MIALYILLGILAAIGLLLLSPLSIRFRYRTDCELTVKAGVPPIMLTLYPDLETKIAEEDDRKKKRALLDRLEKKRAKDAKKKPKPEKASKERNAPDKNRGKKKKSTKRSLRFLARFLKIMLKKFGNSATVKIDRFRVIVGSDDAAKTAYLYGGISATCAYLLAGLDCYLKKEPSRRHIMIDADFTADTITLDIDISVRVRLYAALSLALTALWHYTQRNQPSPRAKAQKG